jgi:hypothetical protein
MKKIVIILIMFLLITNLLAYPFTPEEKKKMIGEELMELGYLNITSDLGVPDKSDILYEKTHVESPIYEMTGSSAGSTGLFLTPSARVIPTSKLNTGMYLFSVMNKAGGFTTRKQTASSFLTYGIGDQTEIGLVTGGTDSDMPSFTLKRQLILTKDKTVIIAAGVIVEGVDVSHPFLVSDFRFSNVNISVNTISYYLSNMQLNFGVEILPDVFKLHSNSLILEFNVDKDDDSYFIAGIRNYMSKNFDINVYAGSNAEGLKTLIGFGGNFKF